jgi:hypothetical protein
MIFSDLFGQVDTLSTSIINIMFKEQSYEPHVHQGIHYIKYNLLMTIIFPSLYFFSPFSFHMNLQVWNISL